MLGVDEGVAEKVRVRHHGDERGGREGVVFKVVDGGIVDLEGVGFAQCGWTVGGGRREVDLYCWSEDSGQTGPVLGRVRHLGL